MNIDGTGFNTCKECHKTESLWNHTTTDDKEGEQLENQRNPGETSCNFVNDDVYIYRVSQEECARLLESVP